MPAHSTPRRVTSTATTVTVTSASTQLSTEAGLTASNTFRSFNGSGLTLSLLSDTVTHLMGYAGKGCYDAANKQVLFMGSGFGGNNPGGYVRNTMVRFRETANGNVGLWDNPQRGFRAPGDSTNRRGMVHLYDSNCLNTLTGKLYHKYGDYPEYFEYDIASDTFGPYFAEPSGHSSSYWWDGMEFIPTRGANGALWILGHGSGGLRLWEKQLPGGAWTTIKTETETDFAQTTFDGVSFCGPVISYNPRAFSGVGGCMLGYVGRVWTINCSTLALTEVAAPASGKIAMSFGSPLYNSGFCRDPVGAGWIQIYNGGNVYRWNGSGWDTRNPSMPFGTSADNFIVIPIDAYGVIWLVSAGDGTQARAWLYRP